MLEKPSPPNFRPPETGGRIRPHGSRSAKAGRGQTDERTDGRTDARPLRLTLYAGSVITYRYVEYVRWSCE